MLMQAADSVAREEIWRECQLMDTGKHNVFSGLRDQYPKHCQDTRYPQLDCSYRCLQEPMSDFTLNLTISCFFFFFLINRSLKN